MKLFMSILKRQVITSSIFVSLFIFMTHNSSVNFKVTPFLLWTKGSHQSPNFDTLKCSDENFPNFGCHLLNHKSVFLQNLHNSLVPSKITPLYFYNSRNQLKHNFFRLSNAWLKICEVPHVNFKTTS